MRYEIIQTQPYKEAVFAIRKISGENIGNAVRLQKGNNGFTGFEVEFLDYHIRMKYILRYGLGGKMGSNFGVLWVTQYVISFKMTSNVANFVNIPTKPM